MRLQSAVMAKPIDREKMFVARMARAVLSPDERALKRDIGQRIRSFREALGMNQQELADKSNVSKTSISKAEIGYNITSMITLHRLARALGVSLAYLVDTDKPPNVDEFLRERLR